MDAETRMDQSRTALDYVIRRDTAWTLSWRFDFDPSIRAAEQRSSGEVLRLDKVLAVRCGKTKTKICSQITNKLHFYFITFCFFFFFYPSAPFFLI
jgi:hypothetical protein